MPDNNFQDKKNTLQPVTREKTLSRRIILSNALDMQIPALPRTVNMVHALTAESTIDAGAIADAILTDCGLTLKFFRVMNSAFFSPDRQDILSLRFMVVLLGFDSTSRIIATVPLLNISENRIAAVIMGMSLLAAEFASQLCENTCLEREKTVPCAMFASLGHLALATVIPDAYAMLWEKEKFPWDKASFKRTTGWLPKDMALRVARAWNLPALIRECIQPPVDMSRIKEDKKALMITVSSLEQMIFCAALMKRSDKVQLRLRQKIEKVLRFSRKKFSLAIQNGMINFEKHNPVFHELLRQEGIISGILV